MARFTKQLIKHPIWEVYVELKDELEARANASEAAMASAIKAHRRNLDNTARLLNNLRNEMSKLVSGSNSSPHGTTYLRTKFNLSEADLGLLLGVPTKTVAELEKGTRQPSPAIAKIMRALHSRTRASVIEELAKRRKKAKAAGGTKAAVKKTPAKKPSKAAAPSARKAKPGTKRKA